MRPWDALARGTLLALLAYAVIAFRDYGLSWDEEHSLQNGEYAVAWYRTLGRDDRAVTAFNQRFYGSAFNMVAYLAGLVSPLGPYETAHLVAGLVAWIGLLFTWRLGRLVGGPRAGWCALVFLALTPAFAGHAFMNPKDVPLAAAFVVAGYYLLRAAAELPSPSRTTLAAFAVATGVAAAVRVIGIFLVGYWAMAIGLWWVAARASRPRWPVVLGWWWKPTLVAWVVMVALWPYAQLHPLWHPILALLENARFQFQGSMLFDGRNVSPQSLPDAYLPTWFAITLPEFYAIALAAAALPALARLAGGGGRGRDAALVAALVVFAVLPPALAVWGRAFMYDGMRHFLFTLPFLAVLAGWGFSAALGELAALGASRRPLAVARALVAAPFVLLGAASLGLTAADLWALHPYEYVYFNRAVAGGQAAASARYETDYWGLSYKEGLDWLRDHWPPGGPRVPVANCSTDFLTAYPIRRSPELSARFQPSRAYTTPPPRLFLATTRYRCHERGGTPIHVVERRGVPLAYVLDRGPPP